MLGANKTTYVPGYMNPRANPALWGLKLAQSYNPIVIGGLLATTAAKHVQFAPNVTGVIVTARRNVPVLVGSIRSGALPSAIRRLLQAQIIIAKDSGITGKNLKE